jgi:magnesium transporter
MISFYRDEGGWIHMTDRPASGTWIHVEEPDDDEIERLAEELGIPRSFLTSALDQREVARTDSHREVHMVIVRAPYDFGDERVPFRTVPLAMIASPDYFITVCRKPIDFVRELNYSYRDEELPTHRAGRMILAILGVVAEWFLLYLEEINCRLEDIENRLKDSIENSEMLELLSYEKSLVFIKTGLEWNDRMVEHLQDKPHFAWDESDVELFKDVRVEYQQGFYMAQTMLEMLEATTDAFASLISNNLNVVMKFLAAVTIVLTIPMIVASIYGMNVGLPGESFRGMFVVLIVLALALTLGVAWWFQRRGWLSFRWRRPSRHKEKSK